MIPFSKRGLSDCRNIADLRRLAKARLPRAIFGYLDGYAEDGVTVADNRAAFGRYRLVPRILAGHSTVDSTTTVLGSRIEIPVILAPTALSRFFHPDGERAVAAAAGKVGTAYALSTLSSFSIEEIGDMPGLKWFQMYVYKDRGIVTDFIDRARASGYKALCLTVDANIGGNREQDIRNGLTIPPRLSARTWLDFALHPRWCAGILSHGPVRPVNVRVAGTSPAGRSMSIVQYAHSQLKPDLNWDDARWMARQWRGPFIIKGVLHPDDARKAVDMGAAAIVVSNHGGRQLDHAPASLDMLRRVVEAVDDRCEIYLDGGVRRGTDVLKAVALGARACLVGRPYLYGLAAAGQKGVARAIEVFSEEIVRDMKLLGCRSIGELDDRFIRRL